MDFSSDMKNLKADVQADIAATAQKRDRTRALIHDAFPSQGTVQPNHMGSQSNAPSAPTTPDMPIMAPGEGLYH